MTNFVSYASFYDLLYGDKDYAAEVNFVVSILQRYLGPSGQILELGCGTGIHALGLAARGYTVHGVDMSNEMLHQARQRKAASAPRIASRTSFQQGDIRALQLPDSYDAAIALFHVISYLTDDSDVASAFKAIRQSLVTGAPFLFDFWHGPAVVKNGPRPSRKIMENDRFRVIREGEPEWRQASDIVRMNYRVSVSHKGSQESEEFEESHDVRYFFLPALTRQLEAGGFRLLSCSSWMTDHPASPDTFSACIVAAAA